MRWILPFFLILCSFNALDCEITIKHRDIKIQTPTGRLIRIAVVDTGMNLKDRWPNAAESNMAEPRICPGLSKDFSHTTLNDEHGHGTHIAGLIAKYAENANYCLIIYKYYRQDFNGQTNLDNSLAAFKEAVNQRVDIINYSGGGIYRSNEECNVIKSALDIGIKVNAAAGNEGLDINFFHFYPAMCDERINIVGGINNYGKRMRMSNYSDGFGVTIHDEQGQNQYSLLPGGEYGYMSGTSQATAIFTGKLVKQMSLELVK